MIIKNFYYKKMTNLYLTIKNSDSVVFQSNGTIGRWN